MGLLDVSITAFIYPAQYQVTTSVVSTPRASDDNILPATSVVDANNDNSDKKPASWDLTAFEGK
jgi:hypothetical protein